MKLTQKPDLEALEQVGAQLANTAEAMALTPKPQKKAAAEWFKKVIDRELARERKRLQAA